MCQECGNWAGSYGSWGASTAVEASEGDGCPAFFCRITHVLSTQHNFVFSIPPKLYLIGLEAI